MSVLVSILLYWMNYLIGMFLTPRSFLSYEEIREQIFFHGIYVRDTYGVLEDEVNHLWYVYCDKVKRQWGFNIEMTHGTVETPPAPSFLL